MQHLVTLFIIFILSFIVQTLVEAFFSDFFLKIPVLTPYQWTQKYIAWVVALVGAFIYQFDVLFIIGKYIAELMHVDPPVVLTSYGVFLTGIAIGKGSNYIHGLIMKVVKKPEYLNG